MYSGSRPGAWRLGDLGLPCSLCSAATTTRWAELSGGCAAVERQLLLFLPCPLAASVRMGFLFYCLRAVRAGPTHADARALLLPPRAVWLARLRACFALLEVGRGGAVSLVFVRAEKR